jgi:hypothetical protein
MSEMARHIERDGHVTWSQWLLSISTKEEIPFTSTSLIRKSSLQKLLPALAGTVGWEETQVAILSYLIPARSDRPEGDCRYDPKSDHPGRPVDDPSQ